ncbi:hypothetical protein ABZP36_013819 [Zizania latifolia]
MGLSISYPSDDCLPAMEDNMGRLFIQSLSFNDMEATAAVETAPASPPAPLLLAFSFGKLFIEGSLSHKHQAAAVRLQTAPCHRSC